MIFLNPVGRHTVIAVVEAQKVQEFTNGWTPALIIWMLPQCQPKRPKPNHRKKDHSDLGWKAYQEQPDYLLDPVAKVSYTYDNAGNLTAKVKNGEATQCAYNAAGKMTKVTTPDETYVAFDHDALGRKVRRTESAWVALGNSNGSFPGAWLGIPPGQTEEKGWGNNADREKPAQEHDQGNGKAKDPCGEESNGHGKPQEVTKPVKHQQHYANGQVLGRKMRSMTLSLLCVRSDILWAGSFWEYY